MKIVDPSHEIITLNNYENMLKHIERIGRVCYKSEDKINDESAEKFIGNLIKRGHESVLEHGNIILLCEYYIYRIFSSIDVSMRDKGIDSYLRFSVIENRHVVSGNVRAWRNALKFYIEMSRSKMPECIYNAFSEFGILFEDVLKNVRSKTIFGWVKLLTNFELAGKTEILTHRCETVRFITDRGVTHELVRHRLASYSQESTRYCNYSKDQFNREITVIRPWFVTQEEAEKMCDMNYIPTHAASAWYDACMTSQTDYFNLLQDHTAQDARSVLPNSLKTEIVMTAPVKEWVHVLKLRCDKAAHPEIRRLMIPLLDKFKEDMPMLFEGIKRE